MCKHVANENTAVSSLHIMLTLLVIVIAKCNVETQDYGCCFCSTLQLDICIFEKPAAILTKFQYPKRDTLSNLTHIVIYTYCIYCTPQCTIVPLSVFTHVYQMYQIYVSVRVYHVLDFMSFKCVCDCGNLMEGNRVQVRKTNENVSKGHVDVQTKVVYCCLQQLKHSNRTGKKCGLCDQGLQ